MKGRDGNIATDDWETPEWLYNELDKEFNFDFDPCPLHANFNGLSISWGKSNFVNPPYNRTLKPMFINKAYAEFKLGKSCVMLIPASTGTKAFHDIIVPNAYVRFIKGRVAFKGYNTKGEHTTKNKGKHDSMIVIFNKNYKPNLRN